MLSYRKKRKNESNETNKLLINAIASIRRNIYYYHINPYSDDSNTFSETDKMMSTKDCPMWLPCKKVEMSLLI